MARDAVFQEINLELVSKPAISLQLRGLMVERLLPGFEFLVALMFGACCVLRSLALTRRFMIKCEGRGGDWGAGVLISCIFVEPEGHRRSHPTVSGRRTSAFR